jgi:hypothetical protein
MEVHTMPHHSTHRMTKSGEYKSWQGMKTRCMSPTDPGYPNYGGRGISVCEEWRDSFEQFLSDMGPKPTPQHTLDRINNAGNYEPGNCRWASPRTQGRNRRSNHLLTHNGQTKPLVEWAEAAGITQRSLWMRLLKGWPVERAVTMPKQPKRFNQHRSSASV